MFGHFYKQSKKKSPAWTMFIISSSLFMEETIYSLLSVPVYWELLLCTFARTYNKYAHVQVDSGGARLGMRRMVMWSCSDTQQFTYRSLSIGSSHSSLSHRHPSGGWQLFLLTQCQAGAEWEGPSAAGRVHSSGKYCQSLAKTPMGCFCLFVCLSC